jgi:hypothetical protein
MAMIVSNPQFNSFYLDSNSLKMAELLAKILTMSVSLAINKIKNEEALQASSMCNCA